MKKINLKNGLTIGLIIFLICFPLISGFTIMRRMPQITVEIPENINFSQAEIFDGLVVNYTFEYMSIVHNAGFSYEYDSGNNFNLTWRISGSGISTWVEDETTRIISMSSGIFAFNDGSHAPIWIFTNVSLYDLVPITVDGTGDHIFNITKEKIFNIPGFGSVEVWQLEDLTFPGGIAWYEKSTGILIKGDFYYGGGYYKFDFTNTNAALSYVQPVSGLFEGLYMFYDWGGATTVNTSYSGYSVNTYNVTMDVGLIGTGSWSVDTTTRIMSFVDSGGPNFLPGVYTLFWINTSVLLGDHVPITVDGEGDHIFQVMDSINLEFPGFGPIGVWELEDLDGNGGLVWYEKNSGVLLNGTFYYSGGGSQYSVDILDTNANFGYLLPYAFTLSTNATDPDTDGIFDLEWTNSVFAEDYSIYEYSSYISEINGSLTPIALDTTNMTKHLSGYSTGEYYFIAVAENMAGLTLSNCIHITVTLPSPGGIPGYSIFVLLLAGLSISIVILKRWKRLTIIK
ncbi:MAG: hypothetical protein ACFFCV_09665 [Promethearchaeota archaeon]